jgi:beta-1,2-mannobiose phosphorylase / 1,2-beta-oligomannan phosphorylase
MAAGDIGCSPKSTARGGTMRFETLADEALQVHASEPLASFYQLSPFVWRVSGIFHVMLRAVPYDEDPAKKIARIYHGTSSDGVVFHMEENPAIAPGPELEDLDGCEDPTVAVRDGTTYVYYTGWNQAQRRGLLMLAAGPDPQHLQKRGIALRSKAGCENPKEAEIALAADGTWRLFFEYAAGDASRVGIARAGSVEGPWEVADPLFERRDATWDSWHLSTGPAVTIDTTPVMFYNGATPDAKWRIGWIRFDPCYERVLERCDKPVIRPPHPKEDETDIAFAASALLEGDLVRVYYSVADQYMRRATIRRC